MARRWLTLAVSAVLVSSIGASARAASLTIQFSGMVTDYSPSVQLDDSVFVGASVHGSIVLDTSAPVEQITDLGDGATVTSYLLASPPAGFVLDVGNFHFTARQDFSAEVWDEVTSGSQDNVYFDALSSGMDFSFTGDPGTLHSSHLTAVPFELSHWSIVQAGVLFEHGTGLLATIDAIEVTPEPGALAWLPFCLAAVLLGHSRSGPRFITTRSETSFPAASKR